MEKAMKLPVINRAVEAPRVLDDSTRMSTFLSTLRNLGYDLAGCAKRLGSFPRLGVNFWDQMRPEWKPNPEDPIDNLITLFVDGQPLGVDQLRRLTSTTFVDAACEMGLVGMDDGTLKPNLSLFPCYGLYIVTDGSARNKAFNQVMWLWGESYLLGGLVNRVPHRRAIDLGTGSGVHAILASLHCQSVTAGDVSPRALEFGRFNAALNGRKNVEFVLSDLFNQIEGSTDMLVTNVPYAPDTAAKAGDNFWSGGFDGWDLTRRVILALPERLEDGGVAFINSLYPNAPGTTIRENFDSWLEGQIDRYEVLDHTWGIPNYEDALSEEPYEGDKSAWRFGVVSVRRAASGKGWWRDLGKRGVFFGTNGECRVVADHDLLAPQDSRIAAETNAPAPK
jgi:SAM-dependent methyltransferase